MLTDPVAFLLARWLHVRQGFNDSARRIEWPRGVFDCAIDHRERTFGIVYNCNRNAPKAARDSNTRRRVCVETAGCAA